MTNNPKEAILAFMTKQSRRAFTLVEILVVISIVAILGALAFPAFSSAISKSQSSEAMSNLRQIGGGILLYVQENNQELPKSWGDSAADVGQRQHWQEAVDPYVGGRKNLNSVWDHARNDVWVSPMATEDHGQHYGLNLFIFMGSDNPWQYKYNRIPNHAGLVIVGETNVNSSQFDPQQEPTYDGSSVTKYRVSHPGNRALYLFADGHVESLAGDQGVAVNPTMWKWW